MGRKKMGNSQKECHLRNFVLWLYILSFTWISLKVSQFYRIFYSFYQGSCKKKKSNCIFKMMYFLFLSYFIQVDSSTQWQDYHHWFVASTLREIQIMHASFPKVSPKIPVVSSQLGLNHITDSSSHCPGMEGFDPWSD